MPYSKEDLWRIFNRTDGHCHICGKKLSINNYGQPGSRGAWEVEHSVAKANGGTDHGNNLFSACISCNRSKGTLTTRTVRRYHGRTSAPLSKEKNERKRTLTTIGGAAALGLLALRAAVGPAAVVASILLGGVIGHAIDPEGK